MTKAVQRQREVLRIISGPRGKHNEWISITYFTYTRSQWKLKLLHLNGSAEPTFIPCIDLEPYMKGPALVFHIVLADKGRLGRST